MSDDEPENDTEGTVTVEDEDGHTISLADVESIEVEFDESDDHTALPMTDADFTGSFDIEVEDTGLFEGLIAESMFEAGMAKELVDDLDDLLSDADDGSVPPPMADSFFDGPVDTSVIEELDIDEDQAETLLKVVYQKLNEFQTETGELPEQLILGLPQFKTIEAYTWLKHDQSAEERLPVDEILVVPGPQIHCVRNPYAMVEADLESEEDDD